MSKRLAKKCEMVGNVIHSCEKMWNGWHLREARNVNHTEVRNLYGSQKNVKWSARAPTFLCERFWRVYDHPWPQKAILKSVWTTLLLPNKIQRSTSDSDALAAHTIPCQYGSVSCSPANKKSNKIQKSTSDAETTTGTQALVSLCVSVVQTDHQIACLGVKKGSKWS